MGREGICMATILKTHGSCSKQALKASASCSRPMQPEDACCAEVDAIRLASNPLTFTPPEGAVLDRGDDAWKSGGRGSDSGEFLALKSSARRPIFWAGIDMQTALGLLHCIHALGCKLTWRPEIDSFKKYGFAKVWQRGAKRRLWRISRAREPL